MISVSHVAWPDECARVHFSATASPVVSIMSSVLSEDCCTLYLTSICSMEHACAVVMQVR